MKPIIYFDLDGVLADFDGEYTRLTGRNWDHRKAETPEEKWGNLEPYPYFFRDLPWFPGAKRMYQYALTIPESEVGICSAASRHVPASAIQKHEWCLRETPEISEENILIVSRKRYKTNYAKGNILVDDMQVNIDRWNEAGGTGFLFIDGEQTIVDLSNHFFPIAK